MYFLNSAGIAIIRAAPEPGLRLEGVAYESAAFTTAAYEVNSIHKEQYRLPPFDKKEREGEMAA